MQIRIAHQLALIISSCVVIAVLAVGSLSIWNLRSGFTDYLRLRDESQLNRLAQRVQERAALEPDMNWLRNNREAMRDLLDGYHPRLPRPLVHTPSTLPTPRPLDGPGPPPLPPPSQPDTAMGSIAQRIFIRDAQGRRLGGHEAPVGTARISRTILVNGATLCTLELAAETTPEGVDAHFLQRQYGGLAATTLGTLLVALLAAWWCAGRWSRPLRALQTATQRIANGELTVHIPEGPAPGAITSGALEIDQLIANVNAMAAALAALEAARRNWIAEISHELRTPLAVLRGEFEAIEDGARQPSASVLASLQEEVMQLTRLVDNLHTLAMADLGHLPCHRVSGNANDALQRIARRFSTRSQQLGLALEIQESRLAIEAHWDFTRIAHMLSNLLENSLRYTNAPGHIRVSWQVQETQLVLTVCDSAPGVAQAHWPRLFDPLFRVDTARSRTGQQGSGLGLSIVQAIVRAHHGSTTVGHSDLGGLMMRISLPLQPAP